LHKANAFLDDHVANHKDQPFYMHFCTDGAHGPYDPAETLAGRPLKGATKMTAHTDMILETDILLGALIDALEKRGLRDDTLVIYTSDNGGLPFEREHGHDSVAGLRGLKATIFEGGTRVPFVASWPGKIPVGTVRRQLIGSHDTVATSLELAGVAIPVGQAIDSVSLVPVLLGKRDDSHPVRQDLMTQSSPGRGPNVDKGYRAGKPGPEMEIKGGKSGGIAFAYYRGDWKLVITSSGKPAGLYDLTNDLAEENNLVANVNQAKRVAMMTEGYRSIRSRKQR
jgi:arylsulfatase A-like enzyme